MHVIISYFYFFGFDYTLIASFASDVVSRSRLVVHSASQRPHHSQNFIKALNY